MKIRDPTDFLHLQSLAKSSAFRVQGFVPTSGGKSREYQSAFYAAVSVVVDEEREQGRKFPDNELATHISLILAQHQGKARKNWKERPEPDAHVGTRGRY